MKIAVSREPAQRMPVQALVIGICKDKPLSGPATEIDGLMGGVIGRSLADGELKGEKGETAIFHVANPDSVQLAPRRVVTVGLGEADKVDAEAIRSAAGSVAKLLRDKGIKRAAVLTLGVSGEGGSPGKNASETAVLCNVEGFILSLHRYQEFKSKKDEKDLERVDLILPTGVDEAKAQQAVDRACVMAEATVLARDLAYTPGSAMTPRRLAEAAERVARETGLEVEIHDESWMESEGMGALLGVARGSSEPPRFIVLRYRSGRQGAPLLAIVGKGLTFDAGGICLKPAEGMDEMKMDKSGGAAVIAAMQGIARLKPTIDVLGVIPATENLPGGRALKPGDVLKTLSGKTIEVINTDAEGRLILADALTYASRAGANWIVDIATLTGAVVIALGNQAAAIIGNDQELIDEVVASGADVGERYWQLPAYEEYKEQYKSHIADIKNVGGRQAGTITGALIVGEFAGACKWAHLDIAGVAWHQKDLPYIPKGASGFGTRTLIRLAERLGGAGQG